MEKKLIVITGVSTGIGRELSIKLSRAGYRVIGTVRSTEHGEELKKELKTDFDYLLLDLEDELSVNSFYDRIKEMTGETGIHCLINNAGIATGGPMMLLSFQELHRQMLINFYSVFSITNALLPLLGAGLNSTFPPGLIINISSVSGIFNTPFLGPYCISKHALESMSDIYRRELAIFGIKLVVIQPGPIQTPIWQKSVPSSNPYLKTDFARVYDALSTEIRETEKSALPVHKISKVILKVLTKKRPKTRYLIAQRPFLLRLIHLFFPDKWMDLIFLNKFKAVMKNSLN